MHLRWSFAVALSSCIAIAQSSAPDSGLLLSHVQRDRDMFGAGRPGVQSLEYQVKKNNSDLRLQIIEDGLIPSEIADPTLRGMANGANLYLQRMVRENDIAVIGTVTQQISTFNTNKTKIVTDTLVRIEEVLYAPQGIHLKPGDNLVATRLGGRIQIDGHEVQVEVSGFTPFVSGNEYLLFLKSNKGTGSYNVRPDGSFLIGGRDIRPLLVTGIQHPATPFLQDAQTFAEMIRAEFDHANR